MKALISSVVVASCLAGLRPLASAAEEAPGGKSLEGTALARTAAAARATPGKMVRFPEGDLPASITRNIPNRGWGEWQDRFFYSDVTGTAQTIAKGVNGEPMSHAEFVPTADGGKGAWAQIGPKDLIAPKGDPTDPDDLIMPGGSELGHPFDTHCLDVSTGDYYFGNYGKQLAYRCTYAERTSKPWAFTTKDSGSTAGHWLYYGGLAFHPNLFGPNDGGLVASSAGALFAWRKSTNTWAWPLKPAGDPNKSAIAGGQQLYCAGLNAVYCGGKDKAFQKVVPGDPPTVKGAGSVPDGTDGKPLVISGGNSYGAVRGSLLDDPNKKTLYLFQRSGRTAKSPHIWKFAPEAEGTPEQWIDLGEHPFNSGPGGEPDMPFITATAYGQGVFWVMCGTGSSGQKMNSYLYCPPK